MKPRRARILLVFALAVSGAAAQPPERQFRIDSLSCTTGPYAIVLPRHYPTLHKIGRHTFTDQEVRQPGSPTLTTRIIQYTGMRLEVTLSSATPDQYEINALEVHSRRWNVGPLSVGRSLSASVKDPAIESLPRDGIVELVGKSDSVHLHLRNGRVDRAHYRCALQRKP